MNMKICTCRKGPKRGTGHEPKCPVTDENESGNSNQVSDPKGADSVPNDMSSDAASSKPKRITFYELR